MEKNATTGASAWCSTYCKIVVIVMGVRLCGFPPFYDDDNFVLFDKIKKGQYDFPSPSWDAISPEAINIVKSLLVVDPAKRMSPDDLLKHPWILGETKQNHDKDVLKKMREWNSKRKIINQWELIHSND